MERVTPNGRSHDIARDALLVAAMDRDGRLTTANTAFAAASRYPAEQISGLDFRRLRHPEMPSGLFSMLAHMLEVDAPTLAYIRNVASDGSGFWTFTLITPYSGGHMVTGVAPGDTDTRDALYEAYKEARRGELRGRLGGVSKQDRVDNSAYSLERFVARMGLAGYVDLVITALPKEVERRRSGGGDAPTPTGDSSRAAAAIREHVERIDAGLAAFAGESSEVIAARTRVVAASRALNAALVQAMSATQEVAGRAPVLLSTLRAVRTQADTALAPLGSLTEKTDDIPQHNAEMRFATAALALLAEALMAQAVAAEAAGPGSGDAAALAALRQAMAEQVSMAEQTLQWWQDTGGSTSGFTESAANGLRRAQSLLTKWTLLVPKSGMSAQLNPVSRTLETTFAELSVAVGELDAATATFSAHSEGMDLTGLRTSIETLPLV